MVAQGHKGVFVFLDDFQSQGSWAAASCLLPRKAGAPNFPSDLCRVGAEATGGGLDTYSWEGLENNPDQTINSEFLFWAFNLH